MAIKTQFTLTQLILKIFQTLYIFCRFWEVWPKNPERDLKEHFYGSFSKVSIFLHIKYNFREIIHFQEHFENPGT